VIDPVWELYRLAHELTGGASTLLEWDARIPEFPVVHEEVLKARAHIERELVGAAAEESAPAARDISGGSAIPQPATFITAEFE